MADTKISGLAAVTTLQDTDEFVLARAGTTKKIEVGDLRLEITDWTSIVKQSDESVASSTTVQDDDEIFFTAVSGAIYEIEGMIVYGSPAGGGTPDLKTDWGEDATARGIMFGFGISNTDSNFTGTALTNQTATIILGTAVADRIVKLAGGHVGAGGTFRMRWAQNSSGINATIVRAGTTLRYRRTN